MTALHPSAETQLEEELASFFGRRHCVLAGSGTSALYLALQTLRPTGGMVIVPAVVCPAVANAVVYAGYRPVFCEISEKNFNLDMASLEQLVRDLPDVVAIIAVHLYGYPVAMDEVERIARARGIAVIEDAAQAMGATCHGKRAGSFGDFSVVSFGHTKILDSGSGGAVLTDDDQLAMRLRSEARSLPAVPENIEELNAEYRRVYYTLKPLVDQSPRLSPLFFPLPEVFRAMHLFGATPAMAERILTSLPGLDEAIERRLALAARYTQRLQHPAIELRAENVSGAVPWRFTFLITDGRAREASEALRALGIPVSNWYPAIHRWYPGGAGPTLPVAEFVGSHVVNLWVDPALAISNADRTCDALLQFLDRPAARP